jgi:hypothetical protein
MPLCKPHVEPLIMKLIGHDVREYEEFKPFVEWFEKSDWYADLTQYCIKAKKDRDVYIDKCLIITICEMGWNEVIVPLHINRVEIMEKYEKYMIWKKCYNDYINNKLKTWI